MEKILQKLYLIGLKISKGVKDKYQIIYIDCMSTKDFYYVNIETNTIYIQMNAPDWNQDIISLVQF